MIDFHTHILPGIDDGSDCLDTTRQLLEEMSRQGVHTVVATPHFYAALDTPEAFLQRRAAALELVSTLQGNYPKMIPGAEVAYFDGMENSGILEQLQVGDSKLLLVEMPMCPWTQRMIRAICDLPVLTGLTPVLAHVDRYRHPDQFPRYRDHLLESGILFQCNTEAFVTPFVRRWALKHLKTGRIHFLGTDTHNLTDRKPNMQQAGEFISKKLGADTLSDLTDFTAELLKIETGA